MVIDRLSALDRLWVFWFNEDTLGYICDGGAMIGTTSSLIVCIANTYMKVLCQRIENIS